MNKPSIKSITLKNLIRFFLLLLLVLAAAIAFNFRSFYMLIVEEKAQDVAGIIKAGLTSHMKAGIMDKRDYFLKEISQSYEIESLAIIRSKDVNDQFGPGNAYEKPMDDFSKTVFETKEPAILWSDTADSVKIRAVIPYQATSEGNLNCLLCHVVPEGTVLGALDMEINATQYRNMTVGYILIVLIIVLLFSVFIVFNMFTVIDNHVKKPLHILIQQARDTFFNQTTINPNEYKSKEFVGVAENINSFNSSIMEHQHLLEEKNAQLIALNEEIEATLKETIFTMGQIEALRSDETGQHTKRVVALSRLLAQKLNLSEEDVKLITLAAPLHDIGKLGIPDRVLHKTGLLDEEEFMLMQSHAQLGYDMIKHSQRDILKACAVIAKEHHERWDGRGYPNGLEGEQIHIYARVVALADVFDALSNQRSYKKAWPQEEILAYFKEQSGAAFDPDIVAVFLKHFDEFTAVQEEYRNHNGEV